MKNPDLSSWQGIPRDEIDWHPTVIADRCAGDGICVTSCGRGVFAFDFEAKVPVVVEPDRCMVGCTTCATICLVDALEFPSRGYVRHLMRRKKVAGRSRELLKAEADRFDVRLRDG